MRVYVAIKIIECEVEVFTSIIATSDYVVINRNTLRRHLSQSGIYQKDGIIVKECEVKKIKGRGKAWQ
jgi:hypothetical protein